MIDFNDKGFHIQMATYLLQDFQYHEQRELVFQQMRFFSQESVSKTGRDAICEATLSCRTGSLHPILVCKASETAVLPSPISQKKRFIS